jgi:hypothetical protein
MVLHQPAPDTLSVVSCFNVRLSKVSVTVLIDLQDAPLHYLRSISTASSYVMVGWLKSSVGQGTQSCAATLIPSMANGIPVLGSCNSTVKLSSVNPFDVRANS